MSEEAATGDVPVEEVTNMSVEEDDFVDPWNVVSKSATGIDYDKLISTFLHIIKVN